MSIRGSKNQVQQELYDVLPVGEEVSQIVAAGGEAVGLDDPLFPATYIVLGATRQFEAAGIESVNWNTASPIRTIFRDAFEQAGLPYFRPHSIRKTLARFGEQVCKSPEDFKAWSQNLGHEQVLTTFMNYGAVATERQGEIIRGLGTPQPTLRPPQTTS